MKVFFEVRYDTIDDEAPDIRAEVSYDDLYFGHLCRRRSRNRKQELSIGRYW